MSQTVEYFAERREDLKAQRSDISVVWTCTPCGQIKPGSEMALKSKTLCKKCAARRQLLKRLFDEEYNARQYALNRKWASANKTYRKQYQLFYKYGLTPELFDCKLLDQDFMCDICSEDLGEDIVVDHDHRCCSPEKINKAGKTCGECVRGLVHSYCNVIEGMCDDGMAVNLLKYRQRWTK